MTCVEQRGVPAHHCVSPAETVGEYTHPTKADQNTHARTWSDPRKEESEIALARTNRPKGSLADFKIRLGPEGYAGRFQQRLIAARQRGVSCKEWFRYYRRGSAEDLGLGT